MSVRDQMQADLREAMRARDRPAVVALRTALAALSNAEAPSIDSAPLEVRGDLVQHVRRELTDDDAAAVLRSQIVDRERTITELLPHGQDAEVANLRAEIAALRPYVADGS
ncbi:GatB/YqeY domain-containing protein [Desertimonas flava]|jgi:uncharacterized protein YqeY|uniref:GatB/YqeY domain-containing protein n=1 Tax=Desertimonas flava TaxID=2064846 RepID=UPI000E35667B|nr:GatB/YqeY domain-containing protein [Desertimonas flava]